MHPKSNVSDIAEAKMDKRLEAITNKIDSIRDQMTLLIRIEETQRNHGDSLKRLIDLVGSHDVRLREVELATAKKPGFTQLDDRVNPTWEKLRAIEIEHIGLEKKVESILGRKLVEGKIFKYVAALFAALFIAKMTGKI